MLVTMSPNCERKHLANVIQSLRQKGFNPRLTRPQNRDLLGIVEEISDQQAKFLIKDLSGMPGVEKVKTFDESWKLVSKNYHPQPTIIKVGKIRLGSPEILVMAGPCAVESKENFLSAAKSLAQAGVGGLRGGAFKPRTSPYSFRGLGEEGLKIMTKAKERTGLPFVTEVLCTEEVELVAKYADVLQIGARNMQNFSLLEACGKINKPVLLKRGLMASIKEFLLSAEYILAKGNEKVMLCERGIRTFETQTRNTLDLSCVPILKQLSHLPVIVDPSHAAGKRELVPSLAKAAVASGADGLLIEAHPNPDEAFSDGRQSLTMESMRELMKQLQRIALSIDRSIPEV